MAKGKHYIVSAVVVVWGMVALGHCESQGARGQEIRGQYVFLLRSADKNVCEKISNEPKEEFNRFEDGLRPASVSLSKLKKELGKTAIYRGRDVVQDKGLWYLEYPFDTAVSTLEGLEDFRRYLSRMVGGETDIDVSEDGVDFRIIKRF